MYNYRYLGKTISTEILNIHDSFFRTTISTHQLNNGCYFITLKGSEINETKKILIKK